MGKSYRFVVNGRVQGVGFRQATAARAQSLGLAGWVRNRGDGAVEGEVRTANAEVAEEFRTWLRQGPAAARVDTLEWDESRAGDGEAGFFIRR